MRGVRPLILVLFAFVSISPAAPLRAAAADGVPAFVSSAEWTEVRTPHLLVLTDGGSAMAWDIARRLERFARALDAFHPELRARSAVPLSLVVFRDQTELEAYKPAEAENLVAFFLAGAERPYVVMNGQPEGLSRKEVVFHEFSHAYLYANFPAVPLWLNEGLAQYYSTCRLAAGRAEFGYPDREVVQWLRGRELLELRMMFAMKPEARAYQRDNELRNVFYAQSYVLTHYLASTREDRSRRFADFLARLQRGAVPMTAFSEVYPRDSWESVIAALPAHMEQMDFEPTRRVPLTDDAANDRSRERVLPLGDVLCRLGELAQSLDEEATGSAAAHFEAAVQLDKGRALAHAGLGLVAERLGNAGEAERHFAEALRLAPTDVGVWNRAGRGAFLRATRASESPSDSRAAFAALARDRFAKSLQLHPGDLDAIGGYAKSLAALGALADSQTLARLNRALSLQPGRADLAAALAFLEARAGHSEAARTVVALRVAPSLGQASAAKLRSVLAVMQLQRVDSLFEAGRLDDAAVLLRQIRREHPEPDIVRKVDTLLASLDLATSASTWVDSANAALELARAGRLQEARAGLVRARDRAPDDERRRATESTLQQLDADLRMREVRRLLEAGKLASAEKLLVDTTFRWLGPEAEQERMRTLTLVRARREIERALGLVRAGKLAEARSVFERVAAMDVSDDLKRYARDRARELKAAAP